MEEEYIRNEESEITGKSDSFKERGGGERQRDSERSIYTLSEH